MITEENVGQLQKLSNSMRDSMIVLLRLWKQENGKDSLCHFETIMREDALKADPSIEFLNATEQPFGFIFSIGEDKFQMEVREISEKFFVGCVSLPEQQE